MSLPGRGKNKKTPPFAPRGPRNRRAQRVFRGAKRPRKRTPAPPHHTRMLLFDSRHPRLAATRPIEPAGRVYQGAQRPQRSGKPSPLLPPLMPPGMISLVHAVRASRFTAADRFHPRAPPRSDGLAPTALAPRGRMDSHPLPSRLAVKHTVQPTAGPCPPGSHRPGNRPESTHVPRPQQTAALPLFVFFCGAKTPVQFI